MKRSSVKSQVLDTLFLSPLFYPLWVGISCLDMCSVTIMTESSQTLVVAALRSRGVNLEWVGAPGQLGREIWTQPS